MTAGPRITRTVVALLPAVAVAALVAACSGESDHLTGSGSAGPAASSPAPGTTSSDGPLPSIDVSGGAGSSGGPTGSAGTSTHDSTKAPRYPSPAGMQPPTATAATAAGCEQLTGGGWRATFLVTFSGGEQWAVVPELGPATPQGDGVWKIVIEEATPQGNTVALAQVKVGGGSPFRTAFVPLPPGVAVTASCPS